MHMFINKWLVHSNKKVLYIDISFLPVFMGHAVLVKVRLYISSEKDTEQT